MPFAGCATYGFTRTLAVASKIYEPQLVTAFSIGYFFTPGSIATRSKDPSGILPVSFENPIVYFTFDWITLLFLASLQPEIKALPESFRIDAIFPES